MEIDEIRCDSATFALGDGMSYAGGSTYESYENGITCTFHRDGEEIDRNGARPSFADSAEDMGNALSLKSVPEDTTISMNKMRTVVESDIGWNCEIDDRFSANRYVCESRAD
jgi:hypothetical protein